MGTIRQPSGWAESRRSGCPDSGGRALTADHALYQGETQWFDEAGAGKASAFTIAFDLPNHDVSVDHGRVLWRRTLANGHGAVLSHKEVRMGPYLVDQLKANRTKLFGDWLKDVADGRIDPGAPGRHAHAGLHALRPEGHLLTILEWNAVGYWLPDAEPGVLRPRRLTTRRG